jgi:hypothetical protein
VAADVFGHFDKTHYFGLRHLILSLVDRALPNPRVRADARRPVEVSLRQKEKDTLICHLVNINVGATNPAMETQHEGRVSTGPVEVTIRLDRRPRSVRLTRTGEEVQWQFEEGILSANLPEVEVMESLVVGIGS